MTGTDLGNPFGISSGIKVKNFIGNGMTPWKPYDELTVFERIYVAPDTSHQLTITARDGERVMLSVLDSNINALGLQRLSVDGVDLLPPLSGTERYSINQTQGTLSSMDSLPRLAMQGTVVGALVEIFFYTELGSSSSACYVDVGWIDVE